MMLACCIAGATSLLWQVLAGLHINGQRDVLDLMHALLHTNLHMHF